MKEVVEDEELPKWARGLNDDQIQEHQAYLDDNDNEVDGIVFENVK
jgi:hypothetical protein